MTESQELLFAQRILANAHQMAWIACQGEPDDVSAATQAILMHALKLSTPDMTHERRTKLFFVHGKDDAETYDNFINSLSPEQRARLFLMEGE